jgi:hypothetical protein
MSKHRRAFDTSFKLQVVQMIRQQGLREIRGFNYLRPRFRRRKVAAAKAPSSSAARPSSRSGRAVACKACVKRNQRKKRPCLQDLPGRGFRRAFSRQMPHASNTVGWLKAKRSKSALRLGTAWQALLAKIDEGMHFRRQVAP